MHFTQVQISEILTQIAKGEDGYRKIMGYTLEALMKAERSVHNEQTGDVCNGYRPRRIFGDGKMLELQVPRSRAGTFYPMLLSILKDQQEEAQKLVYHLYVNGMTTEQVGDIFELVYGKHYSTSQVSHLMDFAREEISLWLGRKLDEHYPILYIDATYIYTRRGEKVGQEAYYTVLGVRNDKTREVLAIVNSPTESATIWKETMLKLKERGVKEVGLVVSDALAAIETATAEVFPSASHQLCTVHFKRGHINKVNKNDKGQIIKEIKEVFDPSNSLDTPKTGHAKLMCFVDRWETKYPSFKIYREPRYHLYFTYLSYDVETRRMVYSTNWIERLNRNYKRTTKMRTALPNPKAVLLLLGSVAREMKAYQYPITNFNNETKLFKN